MAEHGLSFTLRVSKRAEKQIRSAAEWWIQNRNKAPHAFAEELEKAFGLIRSFPSVGESVPHGRLPDVRRVFLSRVRYHLYYTVARSEGTVDVLALWHMSRGKKPRL